MIAKFKSTQYLKTTDRTLIEIIEQHGISPPSDEEHKEFNKLVVGKVTKVDLSAFVMILKCPKCNSNVECDDSDFIECSMESCCSTRWIKRWKTGKDFVYKPSYKIWKKKGCI